MCFALGGLCSDSFVLLAWTASSRPFRALLASPSHSWERVVRASGSTKIALLYKNWSIWHLCVCACVEYFVFGVSDFSGKRGSYYTINLCVRFIIML